MKTMDELKDELQELQNLDAKSGETGIALDEAQKSRLAELPGLIEQMEKTIKSEEDEKIKKNLESALAQKEHYRTKFEKEEAERKSVEAKLEAKLKESNASKSALDVEDYIDISASLEGLDQREKEYLAEQHKLTGKSLRDIRKDENFLLWQSAYQAKVEKEKLALKPSSSQMLKDAPKNFEEQLEATTSMVEKEKMLIEAGLYKPPRPNPHRVNIGTMR